MGEAQRIAVARALVRRPRRLILDEPTSALDVDSANIIGKTIRNLVGKGVPYRSGSDNQAFEASDRMRHSMTIIVITHSLEMMKCADQVAMIEHGTVVEVGAYQELMNKKDKFWRMLAINEIEHEA